MTSPLRFCEYITHNTLNATSPFTIIDVGASGGIDAQWSVFGEHLQAIAFDPLVNECDKLNKLKHEGSRQYIAAFVGAPQGTTNIPDSHSNATFSRTSAVVANDFLQNKPFEYYNSFQDVVLSEEHITLDDFFKHKDIKPNFLKIDTDGHDIEVLFGASRLFKEKSFLGICIESQFHGSQHPHANIFANIDTFLRKQGFTLFDMEPHRYSRKQLPGEFLLNIPAQTDIGQIQWADLYYYRDLGDPTYEEQWYTEISLLDILKLTCLFELQNLHDCAIELLTVHKKRLQHLIDVDKAISLLVPPLDNTPATLKDYEVRFEKCLEEMSVLKKGNLQSISNNKTKLLDYNNVVFFGASGRLQSNFEEIQSYFKKDIDIIITDNDSQKWGKKFKEYTISPPSQLKDIKPDIIVIVSIYANEIARQLINYKTKNHLFFTISNY